MKKIICKALTLSLTSVLLFSVSVVASADGASISKTDGNTVLLNSGWTQKEINDLLTKEEVERYTNSALVEQTTHYIKQTVKVDVQGDGQTLTQELPPTITPIEGTEEVVPLSEDEFYQEVAEYKAAQNEKQTLPKLRNTEQQEVNIQNSSVDYVTDDGYMKYTMQAFKVGTNDYQLNLRFEWVISPSQRGIDILALGHGPQLVQSGNQSDVIFTAAYDVVSNGQTFTGMPIPRGNTVADPGGTAITFELPTSSLNFAAYNFRGYMSYHAQKGNTNDMAVGINGYYKHKVSSLSVTPAIAWPLGGALTISSASTYVTENPPPYFSFSL
ncbi:hypothetical protein D3C76_26840 [compost metagenome]